MGEEIVTFSKGLNIAGLLRYAGDVRASTDELLRDLSFEDTKRRFDDEDRRRFRFKVCQRGRKRGMAYRLLVRQGRCGDNQNAVYEASYNAHQGYDEDSTENRN